MIHLVVALNLSSWFGSPETVAPGTVNFSKREEGALAILFNANGDSKYRAKRYNSNFRVFLADDNVYGVPESSKIWFRVNHHNKSQAGKHSFIAVKITRFHANRGKRPTFSVSRNDSSSNWTRDFASPDFAKSDSSGFNVKSNNWTEDLDVLSAKDWDLGHLKVQLEADFDKDTKHWHATRANSGRSSWELRKWLLKEADGILFDVTSKAKRLFQFQESIITYDCRLISFRKTDSLTSSEPVIFSVDTQGLHGLLIEIRSPGERNYRHKKWFKVN